MPKFIAIKEGSQIKKYNLGKVVLPLTVIRKHLYRTDEKFFHKIRGSADTIMFTDLESTQAYGNGKDFINPDDTIAIIDTAPGGNNKAVGGLSLIMQNPMVMIYAVIAVIILLSAVGLV